MTADEVKRILGLKPHPVEGGWFIRTYESGERVAASGFSEMHRLKSDEIFHFYMGDAVEMLQLYPYRRGERILIGTDLAAGERPQVLAARGVWQGSRLKAGGQWALMGCSVSPGFEFEDYEEGWREELSAKWPEWAGMIGELTRR
jgi:uncharacterized protein